MDSIKNRRTIRKYKAQDIPVDLLNDMLETSFRAATMGDFCSSCTDFLCRF